MNGKYRNLCACPVLYEKMSVLRLLFRGPLGQREKNEAGAGDLSARSTLSAAMYRMQEKRKLISIYFGGGTPSLLEPEEFTEILRHIDAAFKITTRSRGHHGVQSGDGIRCTAAAGLQKSGLNRLSIGVQSFDRDVLRTLGRIHTPEDAVTMLSKRREEPGFAISVWI